MKPLLLVLSVLALGSCALPPESVTGPDGKSGFLVYCNRGYESKRDCHQKARSACRGDYSIRTESSVGMEVYCGT